MWNPNDLKALSDLFSAPSAQECTFPSDKDQQTPATIGPKFDSSKKQSAIDEAIQAADRDSRLQPEFEFLYKQAVTPNDVYLQMSEKTPSSISCEDLIMKIKLPDTECLADIKLDLKSTYIKLSSPLYILALYLPHKVNELKSSAKWDSSMSILIVTMPIVDRDMLA